MRPRHAQHRECYPTLLTTRKRRNLLDTRQTRDTETTQVGSIILLDLARELVLQELHGRHCRIKLIDVMLREISDPTSIVVCCSTTLRLQVSSEHLNERGFTGPVGSDDGDTTIELNVDVYISENDLFRCVAECGFVEL